MAPVRLIVAGAAALALGACVDTGAAPADRDAEIADVEQALDDLGTAAGWQQVDGEDLNGAGCALKDCITIQRHYRTGLPDDACARYADALTDAGVTDVTHRIRGDGSCIASGQVDTLVVNVSPGAARDGHANVAAGYPNN